MKLGEALSLRAVQANRLADLRTRINRNLLTQEGTEPAENPDGLLEQFEHESEAHANLVRQIAETNVSTGMIASLQQREHLRRLKNVYEAAAAGSGTGESVRWMRTELRMVPQVEAAKMYGEVESLQEEIRVLDAAIQAWNWQIDLKE